MTDDEFALLVEAAEEYGIPFEPPAPVARVETPDRDGRRISALHWRTGEPEIVLLHGGAQNCHTWDTVALALDRPVLAVDLPGHGHSDWRADGAYWPRQNAAAIEPLLRARSPRPRLVVGMSLGGLTALALAGRAPDLLSDFVLVDVTPGVDRDKAAPIVEFVSGPDSFASFDELLERTVAFHPARSVRSLRRGLLHNARPRDDGRWEWRYDRIRPPAGDSLPDFGELWEHLGDVRGSVTLVRGGESGVVADADVAELRRRRPDAEVRVVPGAGHSVQGDRPLELAAILDELLRRVEPA